MFHQPGFPAVFISAEVAGECPSVNNANVELLAAYMKREGLTFDRVRGQYQGVPERSFRICMPAIHSDEDVEEVLRIMDLARRFARGFQQDSVLVVRADGLCTLQYCDHRPSQRLGWWYKLASHECALGEGDFSIIGDERFCIVSEEEVGHE